jgi:mono/diheme cytochrome c family protein
VAALSLALLLAVGIAGRVESRNRARAGGGGQARGAGPLDPQLDRGRQVYEKYSCIACHGAGAVGGVHNVNAQTGGMINGLRFVAETYTRQDLAKKILDGVPALTMPSYRGLIGFQETQDLVEYLFSLQPPGARKAKADEW